MTIAARVGAITAAAEVSGKAREFVNLARAVAMGRGQHSNVQQMVADHGIWCGPRVARVVQAPFAVYGFEPDTVSRQKAAVAAGTTLDTTWGLPLAEFQVLSNAFLQSLRNWSAFDVMLAGGMKVVPFRTRVGASTLGITGVTTPQASVKPISQLTLTSTQIDEMKITAFLTMTEEMARFGSASAGDLFATELSAAIGVRTDAELVSVLSSGATSFTSNGPTAEAARVDLRGMLNAITTGARSRLYLLTTSTIAKALSVLHTITGDAAFPTMRFDGGEIAGGIQVLVTDGMPSATMLMADATQIAAASEAIRLDASKDAMLNMDTVGDSPVTASTVMRSLWQNNEIGLRAERFIGVEKLTTTGVCVVTSVNFTGDSPGP